MYRLTSSFFILATLFFWPAITDSVRFFHLEAPIEVKVQKNSPPYQAFKQIKDLKISSLVTKILTHKTETLMASVPAQTNFQTAKKIVLLEPVVIKKFPAVEILQNPVEPLDLSWVQQLPLRQRVRLEQAQARYSMLENDQRQNRPQDTADIFTKLAIQKSANGYTLRGAWEIAGGLALTNDHHVELRRTLEGFARESGEVSIKDGTYNILIDSLRGTLLARMYDRAGEVIGEGRITLKDDYLETGRAPKLVITPQTSSYAARPAGIYNKNGPPPDDVIVRTLNDDAGLEKTNDGDLGMAGVKVDSMTVARFAAKDFAKSNAILISGQNPKTPLFPEKMISALKEIVSEQLSYDLNSPELPVIWGQVLLDGKPVAGATTEMETDSKAKVVYFNALNLPDTQLKETSANGLYAVIGSPVGFQALVAKRAGQYFAHGIAQVENGTVSSVNLESSLKTKNIALRVYDAFAGLPQAAEIEMQSLEQPAHVDDKGAIGILLPEISRLGLIDVVPDNNAYLPARYFYQDKDDFIHLPLIREEWLMNLLQPKWSNIDSNKGSVVGFIQGEGFEVYLAGESDFDKENITYFDAQGKPVNEGVPGGGFVINNLDNDTHEIVVYGKGSEKISSRLVPTDGKAISVLQFQEN